MVKLSVLLEGDKVLLHLGQPTSCVIVSVDLAESLSMTLDRMAVEADKGLPSVIKGENWRCNVQSVDGKVGMRFWPPLGSDSSRVLLTPTAARALAGVLRTQASFAKSNLTVRLMGA